MDCAKVVLLVVAFGTLAYVVGSIVTNYESLIGETRERSQDSNENDFCNWYPVRDKSPTLTYHDAFITECGTDFNNVSYDVKYCGNCGKRIRFIPLKKTS